MKKSVLVSIIVGLAVLAVAGLLWWKPAANSAGQAVVLPVTAAALVAPLDSTLAETTGVVGAGAEQPIPAHVAGRVRNVFFSGGEYVHRGQLLIKLTNHSFVVAPHDGFLGTCRVAVGQYVAPTTLVTTVSALNYLVVPVRLPQQCQSSVRAGDSVRVWVAARPGRVVAGVVGLQATDAAADSRTIMLPLRAPFRVGEEAHVRLQNPCLEVAATSAPRQAQ